MSLRSGAWEPKTLKPRCPRACAQQEEKLLQRRAGALQPEKARKGTKTQHSQ